MGAIFYIAIFGVLFVVINNTLKGCFGFGDIGRAVISVCVSALCLIGLHSTFDVGNFRFHFILLPYVALAIGIFAMLFISWICRLPMKKREAEEVDEKRVYLEE